MEQDPKLIITEDGSHSLFVPALNETYHSFHGALQESRHVFIEKGLSACKENFNTISIQVLEIGLGTGLNALLTAEWAQMNRVAVEMTSIEAYPVQSDIVTQLNYAALLDKYHADEWFKCIHGAPWGIRSEIHSLFHLKKVNSKLESCPLPRQLFQVVFFDAFAPNKQAELWELDILEKIYTSQATNSYFVTYCAKGQLKRDLKSLGYDVETLEGPPGKKEMVRAIKC
ncbi:MAG: tRNA (5-methylaminomethyl-2-thiouridine)(34)-methyltransferase MnmD [Bacteroidota bacterium]